MLCLLFRLCRFAGCLRIGKRFRRGGSDLPLFAAAEMPRLRFAAYREECPTAVGIVEGACRGVVSGVRRSGIGTASAAFSRRRGAVIGVCRASSSERRSCRFSLSFPAGAVQYRYPPHFPVLLWLCGSGFCGTVSAPGFRRGSAALLSYARQAQPPRTALPVTAAIALSWSTACMKNGIP